MTLLYHFRTQGTGAEGVHIAGIVTAFRAAGHEVILASPSGTDPVTHAGSSPFGDRRRGWLARVSKLAPGWLFELLELGYNVVAWRKIGGLIGRHRPELIYERHAFFLFATALLAGRHSIPLVVEVNELAGDERIRATPLLGGLARWSDGVVFRRAQLIVVVSPHLAKRVAALGAAPDRILVLPNAVSAAQVAATPDGSAVREKFGLGNAIVIGFCGWFVQWHRLPSLIEQFAAIANAEPRAHLLLAGEGPLEPSLIALLNSLNMHQRFTITGAVPHAEMPGCLAAMDIGVVPHSNEYRSPIKVFEYMAAGCAIVAPSTEPISQVLTHDVNAVVFPTGDAAAMGTLLRRLTENAPLRERLGAQARSDAAARHTWDHNARAVLDRMTGK